MSHLQAKAVLHFKTSVEHTNANVVVNNTPIHFLISTYNSKKQQGQQNPDFGHEQTTVALSTNAAITDLIHYIDV